MKRKPKITTIGDILGEDNPLLKLAKRLDPEQYDESYNAGSDAIPDYQIEQIKDLVKVYNSGAFKVPESDIPFDYHKFRMVVSSYTNNKAWLEIMQEKHNISESWAFNAKTADYPTFSMDARVFALYEYFFEGETPLVMEFRFFVAFISMHWVEGDDFFGRKRASIWREYCKFKEQMEKDLNGRFPSYPFRENVDNWEIMKDYYLGKLCTDDIAPTGLGGRKYFILIPSDILNDRRKEFEMWEFKFMV